MFDDASRITPTAPGRYRAEADDTWLQGRGQVGGLVGAWITRALEHHVGDADRPIRDITFHLAAPVPPGPVEILVETVRAGARVTHLSARIVAPDGVVVAALATAAGARPDGVVVEGPPAPEVPRPDTLHELPWFPGMPTFARHVDYRFCLGAPPYSGAPVAELGGWGRYRGGATPDRALVTAMLDSWAPAITVALPTRRPVATVDWTVHLHGVPTGDRDAFTLLRAVCTHADEGYAEVAGELRDEAGRLLGRMRQIVALLSARRS